MVQKKIIRKYLIVSYSCQEMYDLVCDIENYHHFLPYCKDSSILMQQDDLVHGQMVFSYMGLVYTVTTANKLIKNQFIGLSLLQGDLESLSGQWRFTDLYDGRCKVALNLEICIHVGMIYYLYNRIIDTLAETMMEKFVDRAYYIYGYGLEDS